MTNKEIKNLVVETVKNTINDIFAECIANDIDSAIQDRVLYPSYDPCIFEVKYPNVDIEGRVTAL